MEMCRLRLSYKEISLSTLTFQTVSAPVIQKKRNARIKGKQKRQTEYQDQEGLKAEQYIHSSRSSLTVPARQIGRTDAASLTASLSCAHSPLLLTPLDNKREAQTILAMRIFGEYIHSRALDFFTKKYKKIAFDHGENRSEPDVS